MQASDTAGIVRSCYDAFFSQDRERMEQLLAGDFTFTSPQDDHIDRAEYFVRCWPHSRALKDFRIETLFERGDEAFVRYRVTRVEDGVPFRNTEFIRCAGGQIREIEVYFGAEEKRSL